MFKAIKRLSAEYRKHEKEIEQLKVEQIIQSGLNAMAQIGAHYQGIIDSTVKTMELYKNHVANESKNGGAIPDNKDNSDIPVNKDFMDKLQSDIEAADKNGKINITIQNNQL